MKTALFGGSYNPLHIGHLHLADELRTQFDYQRIILVPSYISPHKLDQEDLSVNGAELRLEMLRGEAEKYGFEVDDIEIRRKGVSYTIDTVEYIRKNYEIEGDLGLLIGDDLLPGLGTWHRWDELRKMVQLIVAHRDSQEALTSPWAYQHLENFMLPISSREIRERVFRGMAYRFLVPEGVYRTIEERNLYR